MKKLFYTLRHFLFFGCVLSQLHCQILSFFSRESDDQNLPSGSEQSAAPVDPSTSPPDASSSPAAPEGCPLSVSDNYAYQQIKNIPDKKSLLKKVQDEYDRLSSAFIANSPRVRCEARKKGAPVVILDFVSMEDCNDPDALEAIEMGYWLGLRGTLPQNYVNAHYFELSAIQDRGKRCDGSKSALGAESQADLGTD